MMRWWKELTESQQKLFYWGSVFLILIFFFMLLWLPLREANQTLRKQIMDDQTLLATMLKAKTEIVQLRQKQKTVVSSKEPLFGIIDKIIKADNLDEYVGEFKQVSDSEIKVSFANIPFDILVKWLEELDSKSISPYRITITEGNSVGIVAADIFLLEPIAKSSASLNLCPQGKCFVV